MIARIATPIDEPATVVVTGANGFLAQHCISSLLSHGYNVVGTVRDDGKGLRVKATHGDHPNLKSAIINDITDTSSILDVLAPFEPQAIFHLAAPFSYAATDFEAELMRPATEGTRAVLSAAENIPSVRRVVLASSFGSVFDANAGPCPGKTYTADDWSPLVYEDGVNASTVAEAYRASKVASERMAWNFMEDRKPLFDLVSLCPAMVFGPFLPNSMPATIDQLNTSNSLVWRAIRKTESETIPPTRGPVWVDVRDVALAHVKSLQIPTAGGRRFLIAGGVYCNQELADVSRERLPKLADKIAVGRPGTREHHTHFAVDASATEEVLGLKWRDLGDCLTELVPQLFAIESSTQRP
ncbi:NAD dependent epimerase/dehydratase family protein [Sarocladium implicatum]|nr:NAD dependent epimerase/dehydratase family protein [Sarocladium implicatum]